ncbi:flagellar basal body L-ring protein FlgH [Endothiovibrio diazotrophicus]
MNAHFTRTLLVLAGLALLSGCVNQPRHDPTYAATRPTTTVPPAPSNGSIYQAGRDVAWFEDLKARRVGDLLTILLEETTAASKEAKTTISKSNSSTLTNPTILGRTLGGAQGIGSSLNTAHDFSGDGKSDQKNSLNGTISVTVSEVLGNGNLVVRGEKVLTLNRGDEHVRIYGIVRPTDISSSNTVSSSKVADAEIIYSGQGEVADSNVLPWLARFFVSAIMPF